MPTPLFIEEVAGKRMIEKIQKLYRELTRITAGYLIYQDRNSIELIKKTVPQIQGFVLWFLEENRFEIDQELYQGMSSNLIYILEDILEAIKQEDRVLLHDAVAYGLLEYLELFIGVEQEDKIDDNI